MGSGMVASGEEWRCAEASWIAGMQIECKDGIGIFAMNSKNVESLSGDAMLLGRQGIMCVFVLRRL